MAPSGENYASTKKLWTVLMLGNRKSICLIPDCRHFLVWSQWFWSSPAQVLIGVGFVLEVLRFWGTTSGLSSEMQSGHVQVNVHSQSVSPLLLQLPRLQTSCCNTRLELQEAAFDRRLSHIRITDFTPNWSLVCLVFVHDFTFSISPFKSRLFF